MLQKWQLFNPWLKHLWAIFQPLAQAFCSCILLMCGHFFSTEICGQYFIPWLKHFALACCWCVGNSSEQKFVGNISALGSRILFLHVVGLWAMFQPLVCRWAMFQPLIYSWSMFLFQLLLGKVSALWGVYWTGQCFSPDLYRLSFQYCWQFFADILHSWSYY